MLTELAKVTTDDGDVVTLFQSDEPMGPTYGKKESARPFDGFRRRYVFSVEGKGASGWGAVGASIEWVDGHAGRHDVEPWESGAVPVLAPWADANTYGDENNYQPVKVRGAEYRAGITWKRYPESAGMSDAWRVPYTGLERTNGDMTDAGRRRMWNILTAARDLFLALPNAETELTRRSLDSARARQHAISDKALAAMVKLTDRINAL